MGRFEPSHRPGDTDLAERDLNSWDDEWSGTSVKAALRSRNLRPRKSLGQSFLRDPIVLAKIAAAADLATTDTVLEIGPGTGALTDALAARAGRVVAVEIDANLVSLLRDRFASVSPVEVVQCDALTFDPTTLGGHFKLVANIPYYITGPVIRRFIGGEIQPVLAVLMVQREVARRIVAPPGEMNLLALGVQYYASATTLFRVPAGAFYPRPKVDSAVVKIVPRRSPGPTDEEVFSLARAGFGMRRKQLLNSLSAGLGMQKDSTAALLHGAGIAPTSRAEDLGVGDWERLAGVWRAETGAR